MKNNIETSRKSKHTVSFFWVFHPYFLITLIAAVVCGIFSGRILIERWRVNDLNVAREQVQQGSTDDAILTYQRYLRRLPQDDTARLELARLQQRRDPVGALHELRLIPPESPEHMTVARYVASLSLTLDRDYDAIAPLEYLQTKFPKDAGVQQALAEIFFRQRDFEKSLEHARRLQSLKPESVEACLLIAESSDGLGRTEDMIEPLEAALRISTELPQAHLNLAFAYETVGRSKEAMPHIHWFLDRYPTSVAAHRILATAERSQGHYDEALAAALAGRKLAPRSLELAILSAELQLYLRQAEAAYETLNEFVDEWPRERRLLTPLLRAAVLCRKAERAQELQLLLQQIEAKQ